MKFKLIIDADAEEEITVVAHAPTSLTQQIEDLVNGSEYIIGHRDDEIRRLTFGEIECITIHNRKVIAIDTKNNPYRITGRLRDLEALLPSYFIRINKSALANEHRISRFEAAFNGGVDAIFQCGHRDYVSRRCFAEIKRRYEK